MNNLAKYRSLKGLTQTQLAEKIGTSKNSLAYMEKNKLSYKYALKCAEILDVNAFKILGTDALVALPSNEEDKAVLIETIKNI